MPIQRKLALAVAAVVLALCAETSSAATKYSITRFDSFFDPIAINNANQVLGTYNETGNYWVLSAARDRYTTMTNYDAYVSTMNDNGQFVGGTLNGSKLKASVYWPSASANYVEISSEERAIDINNAGQVLLASNAVYDINTKTTLRLANADSTTKVAHINNKGQIIGSHTNASTGKQEALLWDSVSATAPIPIPFNDSSDSLTLTGISDNGTIIGKVQSSTTGFSEVVWNVVRDPVTSVATGVTRSSLPGIAAETPAWGSGNAAEAINNKNQIVGYSNNRAALWENGSVTDLSAYICHGYYHYYGAFCDNTGASGWAMDINDRGQILVYSTYSFDWSTESGYYLLTPVPEPETYALMLGGLGLVGWMARRRNAV